MHAFRSSRWQGASGRHVFRDVCMNLGRYTSVMVPVITQQVGRIARGWRLVTQCAAYLEKATGQQWAAYVDAYTV